MRIATRALGEQGNGLEYNFGELAHSSTPSTKKPKGFNHLRVLNDISEKWVRMGYYDEPGRALRALIGGEL